MIEMCCLKNVIFDPDNVITENNLLYAGLYVVAGIPGENEKNKSNEKQKETWWKRSIQTNIVD